MMMTSFNNGKLIAGYNEDGQELLRPMARNFGGLPSVRKARKNIDPRKNYGPRDMLRMQMERQRQKCSVFLDLENLDICARNKGVKVDYYDLKFYLADESEGRVPQEFFSYVAIDPRREHSKDSEIRQLEGDGWFVKCKRGAPAPDGNFKCGMSVDMAIDIISFAIEARPDIVVLATGNQDFVAVARKLRERGIRCEVAAFPENVSQALINAASSFINLERYLDSRRENGDICREEYRTSINEPDYPDFLGNNRPAEEENINFDENLRYNAPDHEKPDQESAPSRKERPDCSYYDEYDI
jgi:uncharacterized LabA/DUF88 family protein